LSALWIFAVVFLVGAVSVRPLIALLRSLEYHQYAYEDAPSTHAVKTGTPTMGGLLFLLALVAVIPFAHDRFALTVIVAGLGCGVVGFLDDLVKVRGGRNRGLRARVKFLASIVVALLVALSAIGFSHGANFVLQAMSLHLFVPTAWFFVLAVLALIATTHSVNLTDGLDGLAGGCIVPPLLVTAWWAYRAGMFGVLNVDAAVLAAVCAFLIYNRYPAKIMMGDVGSLALGGVLAATTIVLGNVLLLPLIGGVFVAETLSVIIQVSSFKRTGKRIFRMSPLHHHFELGGMPERTVTHRFWIASTLFALVGTAVTR
jgi:phospho-N-acetylmuramoyl-pentapeptide-transferase